MLGPDIPLETSGHADRLRILRSAVYSCLDVADLEEILDTKPTALQLYLNGIFEAACWVLHYELSVAVRNQFELNVFKTAIKNSDIQFHLGLGIGQSVFDQ